MSDEKVELTEQEKVEIALSTEMEAEYVKANQQVKQLQELGMGVDPNAGKLDAFQIFLMELGIVTREQLLRFELAHIQKANQVMNDIISQAEAQKRSAGLVRPPKKTGLLAPDGTRLI